MSSPRKLLLIAALEREVACLVAGWKSSEIDVQGEFRAKCWTQDDVAVIAGGTGWDRAAKATKVSIERFQPDLVTSVGYSGSLTPALTPGALFIPAQVIGFKNDVDVRTGAGEGILLTVAGVAGSKEKAALGTAQQSQAVDMEAAAVAETAQAAGVRFVAIKAISDGSGDRIEFVRPFVTPDGFRTGAFLAHVAVRPWLWGAVAKLARNSRLAEATLTAALKEFVAQPEGILKRRTSPGVLQQNGAR